MMKKVLIIILIIFLSGIAGIASAAQYDWILGIPVQTDTTNYDWLKGAPYVITEAAGAAATTTVSGTVYTDEGSTGIGSDKTVRIKVNGSGDYSATTTASSTYSIADVTINAASDVITAFLDGETEKATTITRATSTSADITGLDLYQNRIITRHEDAGPLTIDDLDKYDSNDDADILFTAASSTDTLTASSTSEFFVWTGKTFSTGGAGGAISLADVDINGTFTATGTQTISVSGTWDATSGTFTAASSTVQFTATSAKNITTNSNSFYNLTFNGASGVWTFQDAATTTNDLTITQGTASSSHNMTVQGGDVTGNGTLNWTAGTFLLDGTGNFGGTSVWTFYDLTLGDGSGTATTTSTGSATTTVSDTFTIAANQILNAGSNIWEIAGASTSSSPFLINGTFNAQTSTFKYTTDQDTNITAATYYNLDLIDPPRDRAQGQPENLKTETFISLEADDSQEPKKENNSTISKIIDFFHFHLDRVVSYITGKPLEKTEAEESEAIEIKSKPVITRTPTTDTVCVDGKCTMSLYSGIRNVYEDGRWKRVEEARSLKNSGIECIVEFDGIHEAECLDWNYTHRKIKFSVKDELNGIPIPVKVLKKNESFNEFEFGKKNIGIKKYEKESLLKNEKFIIKSEKNIILNSSRTEWIEADYGDVIHFGEHSTTIKLQDPDTENLDDNYLYSGSSASNYGASPYIYIGGGSSVGIYRSLIKFDLSSIPSGQSIDDARLYLYAYDEAYESGDENYAELHRVYPYPTYSISGSEWNETNSNWNERPVSEEYNETYEDRVAIGDGGSGQWYSWDASETVTTDYGLETGNVSIYFTSTVKSGTPTYDCMQFHSKEYTTDTSLRPYLNITYSASGPTYTLATTTDQTFTINNDLTIGNASDVMEVTGATHNPIIDVGGNVTITASSTLIAATSSAFTVGGSWSNTGTFTHSTSTVTFDSSGTSTFSGVTSFYNLTSNTASKTLEFATGTAATTTVSGTLTLNGQACDTMIKLYSSQSGSQFYINAATSSINYTDIKDSNAITALTADNSVDSENNTNWTISRGVCYADISGTVYTDEGSTGIGADKTVRIKVNGSGDYSATTTASSTYSIADVTINAASDVITAFLDGETEKATTITRATSTSADITGLDLYQNRIITRHEDAGPLTIDDLDKYDSNDDADILFTAASSTDTLTASSTSEFFVWTGKTFSTGGAGGAISLADVDINGTFTATGTQTISVSGTWDATSGTFTAASSTVQFTATSAKNITTNSNSFYNLTFNGASGVWTFQDAATTTNDLTITQGTASSSNNMTVQGGDVTGNGTLNWTAGTFLLDGTGNFGGTSVWTFYDLTFGDGSGTATTTSTGSATTTVSDTFTIAANQILNAGSNIWEIAGASTSSSPFLINGTFNAQTSTFKYTTDQDTNITAATYYNLDLIDPPRDRAQGQPENLKTETFISLEADDSQEPKKENNSTISKIIDFFHLDKAVSYITGKVLEKEKVQELTFDKIKPLKFYSVKDKNPEETDSPRYVLKTLGNDIIEVGTKENSPLAPYVKLNKWDEECSISVSLPTTASTNSLQSEGNKLKWIEEKREAHFYPQNDNEFEFEIILKEKPATNIVSLNIESKGLDFFYQPALTLADNPEADYCIDTACYKDNATTTYRPENVVGSYAVYHSTKQGDYSKMGGKNYRAGKAFHVYRPKIIDSAGAEVWGRLNINEQTGVLTVEIPQEFLDNAVYPVRHAAGLTFGYTDIGDGLMTYYNNYIDGFYSFSPVSDGTVSKISFYGKETTAGGKLRPIIYKTSDDSRICYGNEIDAPTSAQWNNMSLSGSVVASTDYMLSIWFGAQHFQFSYDSIAGYHIADEYETYHSTNPPPATCGWDGGKPYQADWKVSIYCTYTATGPTYTLATTTGQTFTINNNLTIGNALDVMSVTGATHNPIIDVGGNVTITASSTLIAATSSAFTVGGSWSNTGTFTHSTSTVTFDATASGKTITAGGSSFSSITFNGSGGEWTLQDALDVNNAFNLTNGTLAQAADNNINIAGNVAIAAGGVFTKAGGTGKVIFDGDLTYQDADEDQNLGNLEIGTSPDTTDLSSDLVADSLTVQSGDTLNTNGYELDITNNITINGTLDATDDGELDGCQINLGGSWDSSSGTFTCATSTVVFDSADAGETVNSGSSDFYNLTFNNGSGGWTFSAAATTTNDFTITNGSVTSTSATLTVGGSYSNSGTFTHNSGTVTFDATASGKTITDGGSAFHLLNFNGAGGEWLYKDGCSTAPATTTIQAGTPTFLNAKTGNTSVTGGTLNTDWYLGAHVVNKDATSTDIDTGDNDITISAAAPWYNSSWSYRKSIPISNTTSTQTDYQVKIEVATSTGGDVTCDGHCQDDFDDVRFTTSNGTTLIDYWREDYTTSSTSTFWAEIPTLTGSATTTIYMYYGNASATTTSNGTSTFAFFDDFESYSIGSIDGQGDWSITTGSSSVSVQNGRNHLRMGAGVTDGVHAPVDTDNQGYAIMAKVYSSDCDESFQIAYSDGLSTSYDPYNGYAIYHRINVNRERLMEYNDGVRLEEQWPYITPNTISSTYYIFELDWYNAGTLDFKIDGNSRRTETDTTFSSFTYIHFTGHHDATWYVDEVFVRKYASPEPSIGTTGSEETSVPATIWKYNSGWGTASTTQTTGSGADGKTPQPTTDGAIRIREYSKTSSATTTYKYNLAVSSQSGFGAYNYYSDQGSNYITSASSTESSGVDKCISDSWHRNSAGTMNTPYSAVDDPPTNGSWYIGMTSNITVSGTVYQTEGGSNIGADKSILLKVDGAGSWSASTTAGGVYEITSITGISAGSTITAWISGDATYKGTAVTIANNGSSNITGFDIYGGAVIARSDKTSTALTIADMVDYDKDDDSDIHFTATTSPSASLIVDNDSELHIWIGKEFAPGGNVTLTHGGAKGDLHIDGSATFTGSTTSTYSIGGSWTASSTAVFTAASSTVQFTATTTGKTITTGGSDFYDLTFDGSGGGWTFQDAATTTNDLTITTGAVTSTSGTLAIGGSWSNAGTFTHNSGTVLFNATASGKTITTGGSDFYDLTFDGSGGVWDFQDAATTTNDLTITDGTLDLNGQNLVVQGGDISVSGILAADVDSGAVSLSGEGNLGGSGTTTVYDISFSGTTTLAGGIDVNNDLTISGSNSLDASSSNYAITVGGSWSNSGTFTAQSGAVTFDSGDAGETIDPGSSSFFDVNFNNTAGGWTISENATSTHNWQLANGTSFTVASGKTIEAQGRFFNGVGGSTTTWTGSTLDLNSLKGNSSLDFDGDNDYVDCGDGSSLLMGSGNFTVSAWIKATSGGDGWIVVKGSGWSGGKRYGIAFTTDGGRSDGTIKVAIDDNSTRKNVFSTSQYADGEWHFVAAMRDGDNLRLYIDGSEDANSPTDISGYSSLDNNRICSIGAIYNEDTSAMAQYFNGAIDEVRIYNRALSSTEINEHYQGLFKNETGLVGLWHFAEGTGTTTADSSGQGNNGTLKPTASEPTWVTDAPLYTINSTSTGADIYSTLEVGASTDVRMWNSYSATSTVDSTGSLYSMDHDESGDGTGDDGKLFIWGDYHTISTTTDYWSYATDFDGTAGADRQCKVYVQQNATTTVDSGATLNVKGGGSSSGDITIVGQGASSLWDFACNGTCSVQESTWNYLNLSGGTLTVLNTTLNNEDPPDAGATLNVDWYLGAHVVDAAATSTDVDTGDNDITISAAAPWYNSSWSYREKITIDHTKVATSTQTNFPVLINSTSTDWKDTTNGGHVGQSDGGDILFTKADGSTKLDHEIEKYASSTGEVIAWIEVDSLSHSADTVLYMYYGNASSSDQWDITGTWNSNFKLVQHLQEYNAGENATHTDSTINSNDGTPNNFDGTSTSTQDGTGQIDGADVFDGSDDYISCEDDSSLNPDYVTVTFWFKPDSFIQNSGLIAKGDNTHRQYWIWLFNSKVYVEIDEGGYDDVTAVLTVDDWYHFAVKYNGSRVVAYLNGDESSQSYDQSTGTILQDDDALWIGALPGFSKFDGTIDEVRVSDTARSGDWIKTSYDNQNSPSTFYSVGSEETSVPATIWKYNSGWGSASTTQTTGSGADGKTPQPNTDGAVRIREYSKTSSATTTYKYNLAIAFGGFDNYDYYSDYGSNYIISASSTAGSGVDKCISENWQRDDISALNTPYSAVNDPPTNGSWYIGMSSDLEFSVSSATTDLGTLNSINDYTATGTTILYATTSYSGGYNITAWASDNGRLQLGATGTYITRWNYANSTPAVWPDTCNASSTCGFGYTTSDNNLGGGGSVDRFAASTKYAGFATTTPGDRVADSAAPASGATTTIMYRTSVSSIQSNGDYSVTIHYICTANY